MRNKEEKNDKLPKLKKNIKKFLNSEEGKISKKGIIKAGILLGAVGAAIDPGTAVAHTNWSTHSNLGVSTSGNTCIHNSGHSYHDQHDVGGWC